MATRCRIIATEKATSVRYAYCINSGVDWFAPLSAVAVATMPSNKAEERIRQLQMQELVLLFRKEQDGVAFDCETVNLHRFTLTTEDAPNPDTLLE
jgi:hypothetical protein